MLFDDYDASQGKSGQGYFIFCLNRWISFRSRVRKRLPHFTIFERTSLTRAGSLTLLISSMYTDIWSQYVCNSLTATSTSFGSCASSKPTHPRNHVPWSCVCKSLSCCWRSVIELAEAQITSIFNRIGSSKSSLAEKGLPNDASNFARSSSRLAIRFSMRDDHHMEKTETTNAPIAIRSVVAITGSAGSVI